MLRNTSLPDLPRSMTAAVGAANLPDIDELSN